MIQKFFNLKNHDSYMVGFLAALGVLSATVSGYVGGFATILALAYITFKWQLTKSK